jgi:hypothetical protein
VLDGEKEQLIMVDWTMEGTYVTYHMGWELKNMDEKLPTEYPGL